MKTAKVTTRKFGINNKPANPTMGSPTWTSIMKASAGRPGTRRGRRTERSVRAADFDRAGRNWRT